MIFVALMLVGRQMILSVSTANPIFQPCGLTTIGGGGGFRPEPLPLPAPQQACSLSVYGNPTPQHETSSKTMLDSRQIFSCPCTSK